MAIRGLSIVGAGGHAKVAAAAWMSGGHDVHGFFDDDVALIGQSRVGHMILGPVAQAFSGQGMVHLAIGNNKVRMKLAEHLPDAQCPTVIHSHGWRHISADVGAGTLICAGVIVQPDARIGRHCIINTGAIIEHDNIVEDFVHIAPGVRLAGDVHIGRGAFIGAGAVVIPGIKIGMNAVVGAGAVVVRDVPEGDTVAGCPARKK